MEAETSRIPDTNDQWTFEKEEIYIKEEPPEFLETNLFGQVKKKKSISQEAKTSKDDVPRNETIEEIVKEEPDYFSDHDSQDTQTKQCNVVIKDEQDFLFVKEEPNYVMNDIDLKEQQRLIMNDINTKLKSMHNETNPTTSEYEVSQKKVSKKEKSSSLSNVIKVILCPSGELSELEEEKDDELSEIQSDIQSENENDFIALAEKMTDYEIEDASDDENLPLSSLVMRPKISPIPSQNKASDTYEWQKVDFHPPNDTQWKDNQPVDESWYDQPPIYFFNLIFDNNLIKYITEQTIVYALQKDGKELRVSENEMKSFLGILMVTGIIKAPSYRSYWKGCLGSDPITNSMSRDRFEEIKRYLHFNDNSSQKPRDHPSYDKLYKIRPVIEAIRTNCRKSPQEEHQSIDEQIIPTKARISLKQYNPKKTHKWGYKVIARAGASGYIYDFEVYTGKTNIQEADFGMGISSSFVVRLAEGIPKQRNYKLYFDNWFSSISLAKKLKEDGIFSLSTIRPNRLKGCILEDEKHLKREGRGSFDYRVETTSNIVALKWFNNKSVHCLSTYAGLYPMDEVRRWDRTQKEHINIPRPHAIKEYNKFMGGVDLCDMLLELYRIDLKSKKWYMRIFFYLMDLAVVNAWLLYRRVCTTNKKKCILLCDFKEDIAMGLLASNTNTPKRGRPSTVQSVEHQKKRKMSCHPAESVRLDNLGHLPNCVTDKRRCKLCVNGFTRVICVKCKVGLCLTNDRNCYMKYHQK